MSGYIGKFQVGANKVLLASTSYGICKTNADSAEKNIQNLNNEDINNNLMNTNYNAFTTGTTIHIKFIEGNSVTENVTLRIGTVDIDVPVIGKCTCPANTILSFTYDELEHWVVNDNVDTNTEYVFKTAYDAQTNKVLTEQDIGSAAEKNIDITINSGNVTSTNLPTTYAVTSYVQNQISGLSDITGAMHFKDQVSSIPPATGNYVAGDVVILESTNKEYVYNGLTWIELGDEGSYALKSNQATIIGLQNNGFTTNTLPSLTITSKDIPNVISGGTAASLTTDDFIVPNVTAANSPTSVEVEDGVLKIIPGNAIHFGNAFSIKGVHEFISNTPAQLGSNIEVGSASGWNAGSQASLNTTSTVVVVPTTLNSNN